MLLNIEHEPTSLSSLEDPNSWAFISTSSIDVLRRKFWNGGKPFGSLWLPQGPEGVDFMLFESDIFCTTQKMCTTFPHSRNIHPRKLNIEPENDGLKDDFPLPRGVFLGSMLMFRGV